MIHTSTDKECSLCRLIRRPELLIGRHWYLPANWRSIIRWSPDQWISQCYAIERYRSFYCALFCVFMTRVSLRSEHPLQGKAVMFLPSSCGGRLEYLHHSPASRRRRQKGSPVPLCHWGIKMRGLVLQVRAWRQGWQNLLRNVMVQEVLFHLWWWIFLWSSVRESGAHVCPPVRNVCGRITQSFWHTPALRVWL
jgi:hypothetical protein